MNYVSQKKIFLKEFIKNSKQIGSITPSSRFLSKKIINKINFNQDKLIIVELGPGTGVFTKQISKKLKKNDILIVIELNKEFYQKLKTEYHNNSNVKIFNDSALHLTEILSDLNVANVDYIISSLPFKLFCEHDKIQILNQIKNCIGIKGNYIQYQYSLNLKDDLKSTFKGINTQFVPLNAPPAWLYTCNN